MITGTLIYILIYIVMMGIHECIIKYLFKLDIPVKIRIPALVLWPITVFLLLIPLFSYLSDEDKH